MRQFFDNQSVDDQRIVYSTTTPVLGCPMIRQGDLKYVRAGANGPEMLFDLARDPSETCSVASEPQYAEALKNFRILLHQCLSRGTPALPHYNE